MSKPPSTASCAGDPGARHGLVPKHGERAHPCNPYGATHQAVQQFQVVTSKRLPKIIAGRSLIKFYYRKDLDAVAEGVEECNTDTGTMRISSPALTALDMLRYPRGSGGMDNVATALTDLGPKIDEALLARLSRHVERPVVQRLGYLLDLLGFEAKVAAMHEALRGRRPLGWVELERHMVRFPDMARKPVERNAR